MYRGGSRLNNRNVRFGSKGDMCAAKDHVRFTPESGHWSPGYFPDKSSSRISTVRKLSPERFRSVQEQQILAIKR
jgi:hypothetical protein